MLTSLIACAALAQTVAPAPLEGVSRIVMLGDSITQMGGDPKGYVTLVRETLKTALPNQPIEVVNAGIGGHKSTDMLARFQKDVLDMKPQLVTISVGVNDVWHDFMNPEWTARVAAGNSGRGVPLPKYVECLDAMVQRAKAQNIRVVLLSPSLIHEDLPCAENRRLAEYVRAGQDLARRNGLVFVNLHRAFRAAVSAYQRNAGRTQLLLTTDGVHLNDAGNALMAGMVLRALGVKVPDTLAVK